VTAGRGNERAVSREHVDGGDRVVLRIPDAHLSSSHFRLSRIGSMYVLEDAGSKNGTIFQGNRVTRDAIRDGDIVQAGESFFVFRESAVLPDDPVSPVELAAAPGSGALSTIVPAYARELARIRAVARSQVPVVLQ